MNSFGKTALLAAILLAGGCEVTVNNKSIDNQVDAAASGAANAADSAGEALDSAGNVIERVGEAVENRADALGDKVDRLGNRVEIDVDVGDKHDDRGNAH